MDGVVMHAGLTLYSGSRINRIIDSLYGAARLQPAQASIVTRSRLYCRCRDRLSEHHREERAIFAIRLFHSVAFLLLAGSVIAVAGACALDRITGYTRLAMGAVIVESAIILANGGRCPLTSVVEDLGAEHGSVSDIFLPDSVARNIPHVSTALLGTGILIFVARRIQRRVSQSRLTA